MFKWILLIVAIVASLRFLYLLMKRLFLICKVKRRAKKSNGNVRYCRNPLISIFKYDGKTDLSISLPDRTIEVAILTTPLRQVRYHFDINNKLLELIIERKGVYVVNHKVANGFAGMDRVYTIWKYKIDFETPCNGDQKYVILNPAPRSVSKAEGATLATLGNNDILVEGIKLCGLKWFIENVI